MGKIAEFDRVIRSGIGDSVDVAVLKLCYVDVREGDDVNAVFEHTGTRWRRSNATIPDVTFLYMTVPLTTEFGGPLERAKRRVKDSSVATTSSCRRTTWLGRSSTP